MMRASEPPHWRTKCSRNGSDPLPVSQSTEEITLALWPNPHHNL